MFLLEMLEKVVYNSCKFRRCMRLLQRRGVYGDIQINK